MARSQNGWPAFHSPEDGNFVRFEAGGRGFWAANADVAYVAQDLLETLNSEVEPIIFPGEEYDDWSFADRLVRDSDDDVSNHGSATAWDMNSTRHVLGRVGTFTVAEVKQIHAILNRYKTKIGKKIIRWGGDYLGRKDEMHFEIVGTKAEVAEVAAALRMKEQNMPLNDADVDKIWNSDRIPVNGPDGKPADPKNPMWQVDSAIAQILKVVVRLEDRVGKLQAQVDKLSNPSG